MKKQKTKTCKQLEDFFGQDINDIITNNYEEGTSRHTFTNKLRRMTNNTIKMGPSTIFNIVKRQQDNGHLKNFKFSGRTKLNPNYQLNHERRAKSVKMINIHYQCLGCEHEFDLEKEVKSIGSINLRTEECPNCFEFGLLVASSDLENIPFKKAIKSLDNGLKIESFVDNDLNMISNPFESREEDKEKEAAHGESHTEN